MINWKISERPILYNPIFVEGLPGVGNVGKMVVEYLIEKLGAKKFADLYSDHFPYHVFINDDSVVDLPKNEFYFYKGHGRDIVFMTGDFQSMTPHGHYEMSQEVLKFSKGIGVKNLITIGGFGVENIPKKPKVLGAVTDKELRKDFKKLGVEFEDGERVGMIVGASGLLLGLGKLDGMQGVCLMGETFSRPMFTDARAAKAVLKILTQYFGLEIDMGDMNKKSKELDKAIGKAKQLEERMKEKLSKSGGEDLRYIG